jgi:hypothetical protein
MLLVDDKPDDMPIVDTLTLPPKAKHSMNNQQAYWLRLADVALARAREEQDRIKEQIRRHVERYNRITRHRKIA